MFDPRPTERVDTAALAEDRPRTASPPPLSVASGPGAYDLEARIGRHLTPARRHGTPLALLSVAIVPVAAGDAASLRSMVVMEFGRRLQARLRGTDEVWRTGEHEFTAVLTGCRPDGALAARRRLFAALGEVYQIGAGHVRVAARIGIAAYPVSGDDAPHLLAAARESRDGDRGADTRRG